MNPQKPIFNDYMNRNLLGNSKLEDHLPESNIH